MSAISEEFWNDVNPMAPARFQRRKVPSAPWRRDGFLGAAYAPRETLNGAQRAPQR